MRFVDKKAEISTYLLSSTFESVNLEMTKRLKYTQDIIVYMLSTAKKIKDTTTIKENVSDIIEIYSSSSLNSL